MKNVMKAIAAIMLMTAVVFTAGCDKLDEPYNGGNNNEVNLDGSGTYNGHDYVDLGLPSGTMWATCNIGANTPIDCGDYFAWGETETKTTYDWSTYKWSKGDYDKLTKYCSNSNIGYNQFTDNLTLLQDEDDAATANWGNGWCMPTDAQLQELIQNTTCVYKKLNGMTGRLFTASNGHSLFFPETNVYIGDELIVSPDARYWSKSLDTAWPCRAWYLFMGSPVVSRSERCRGLSIRPVHSAK